MAIPCFSEISAYLLDFLTTNILELQHFQYPTTISYQQPIATTRKHRHYLYQLYHSHSDHLRCGGSRVGGRVGLLLP